jgi:hypothetical protein
MEERVGMRPGPEPKETPLNRKFPRTDRTTVVHTPASNPSQKRENPFILYAPVYEQQVPVLLARLLRAENESLFIDSGNDFLFVPRTANTLYVEGFLSGNCPLAIHEISEYDSWIERNPTQGYRMFFIWYQTFPTNLWSVGGLVQTHNRYFEGHPENSEDACVFAIISPWWLPVSPTQALIPLGKKAFVYDHRRVRTVFETCQDKIVQKVSLVRYCCLLL